MTMAAAAGKGNALVRAAWSRRSIAGRILRTLLLPWSAVFRAVVGVRNRLYDAGCMNVRKLPLPVVSIGNLTVGGTGKTPTGLWLAQGLRRRGLEAAILTRGYGGRQHGPRPAVLSPERLRGRSGDRTLDYGDEPVMLSALHGQTVVVGADRYRAGLALSEGTGGADLFLLDDGFQHRRLARDLDMVLLGADSSGAMLPAGPFREPIRALRRADILVVTGARDRWRAILQQRFDDSRVFHACLRPRGLLGRTEEGLKESSLAALAGSRVLAVAGVARPEGFYEMIRECEGIIGDTLEFPDHHAYSERDWREISRHRVDMVVTTEKDYVKLARFPFSAGKLRALRVEMSFDRPEALLDHVVDVVRRAGSSSRGGDG